MILDELKNAALYLSLHPSFKQAFTFLLSQDLNSLPVGKIDLVGDDLYVLVQEYLTKSATQGIWEAHQKHIDIQYMLDGTEKIGFASCSQMNLGVYNPEKDFQPMSGNGQEITLHTGSFLVFFPQDAHMPCLSVNTPARVKKIVVKIRL